MTEPVLNTFADLIGTNLTAFAAAMMDIWQDVVTFLMTSGHELCLLGVFAWLFVLGCGGIRKILIGAG